MVFETLETAEIAVGEPTRRELFRKIKDSLDDHEDRLSDSESVVNTFPPLQFRVHGDYSGFAPLDEVAVEKITFGITILSARILVVDAGSSGTLEVDIEYKRGGGAWTSIFATKPSVAAASGDYAQSSNAVLSVTDLELGDLLRLNIDQAQVANTEFVVILEFEKSS